MRRRRRLDNSTQTLGRGSGGAAQLAAGTRAVRLALYEKELHRASASQVDSQPARVFPLPDPAMFVPSQASRGIWVYVAATVCRTASTSTERAILASGHFAGLLLGRSRTRNGYRALYSWKLRFRTGFGFGRPRSRQRCCARRAASRRPKAAGRRSHSRRRRR